MRTALIVLAILVAGPSVRAQLSCGDPPRIDDQSLKGDIEGKAKFLTGIFGDANLKAQLDAARTDVFQKYPDANKARSDTYFQYLLCTAVLSDSKLSAQEKFRMIQEFRQPLSQPGAQGSVTTSGAQSPVVQGTQGGVNLNYGVPPPAPVPAR